MGKFFKVMAVAGIMLFVAGYAQGISGMYESDSGVYSVKFTNSTECIWYQDGMFFNGTYNKTNDIYQLEIFGNGFYPNTVFNAKIDGKDLIITGGIVYGERFIKK
jgi:hypothetical protein